LIEMFDSEDDNCY